MRDNGRQVIRCTTPGCEGILAVVIDHKPVPGVDALETIDADDGSVLIICRRCARSTRIPAPRDTRRNHPNFTSD